MVQKIGRFAGAAKRPGGGATVGVGRVACLQSAESEIRRLQETCRFSESSNEVRKAQHLSPLVSSYASSSMTCTVSHCVTGRST
jgi:hypothetical protein